MCTKLLLLLTLLNSLNFIICKTPLSMGLTLLIQTILISMNSGVMSPNFWFSYILFMIMIGSMLVLFIYISSLTSNLKFKFNKKNFFFNLFFFLMLMYFLDYFNFFWNLNIMNFNFLENWENNLTMKIILKKMFSYSNYKILMIMINYMLLTLFIVVKIVKINKGPLRKL
uniref:NADH dehydrogenase subunit 6 n=1 Tax=Leptocimbex linealis TaxID=2609717 RepID=UPI002238DCCD|nr:NADH dehydrogenase subunit 6 [Leptocimbex linealis]UYK52115.1 NADH dehydrogenase subunit 6 [Leptocimbex linealis]